MSTSINRSVGDKKWIDKWYSSTLFYWNENLNRDENYIIDTPPPTVSGHLHMGHIFSYCHADFIARYQRMRGKNVFYPIGFDDNGLPTERLAEKIHKVRGVHMASSGKNDEFKSLCDSVILDAEREFEMLFKKIGLSFDWRQKYQTISKNAEHIAHHSFADLYNKELIYQSTAPVYWDTIDRTAVAQAEIEDKEMDSQICTILFSITNSDHKIELMTTRPEMIPACVAVFYHPEDKRYNGSMIDKVVKIIRKDSSTHEMVGIDLTNQSITTPLVPITVLAIPDEDVKIEIGTGIVMCCTYGDIQDVVWVNRHKLNERIIISNDGTIDKNVYEIDFYTDTTLKSDRQDRIKVSDARSLVIDRLLNIMHKNVPIISITNTKHVVKCAERSGAPIEILPKEQWYIDFGFDDKIHHISKSSKHDAQKKSFKENILKIVDHIDFHPPHMKNKLTQWINGLNQNWCISRDRFVGIPIPSYTNNGNDSKQVFDTWFTSSLSPQLSAMLIIKTTEDNKKNSPLFPMHLRPQAHEIIRTWAFYTIVKSYLHAIEWSTETESWHIPGINWNESRETIKNHLISTNTIPWENIMLSGWCLANDGSKMSKSKGNIVRPVPLIDKHGADVIRYWTSASHPGCDTSYNETKFRDAQKLLTKLQNVAHFCKLHLESNKINIDPRIAIKSNEISEKTDLWIISHLHEVTSSVEGYFDQYEYCKARECIEEFFWQIFCNNYLEMIKGRIYGISGLSYESSRYSDIKNDMRLRYQNSAILTLYSVLRVVLQLFAPFIPFICDEIYHSIFTDNSINDISITSIHKRGSWIHSTNIPCNIKSLQDGNIALHIISSIRKTKATHNLSVKAPISSIIMKTMPDDMEFDIRSTCNALDAEIVIDSNAHDIHVTFLS